MSSQREILDNVIERLEKIKRHVRSPYAKDAVQLSIYDIKIAQGETHPYDNNMTDEELKEYGKLLEEERESS